MFKFFKRGPGGPVSFEQQISTLANCGIKLGSFDRAAFEGSPYRLLLVWMDSEAEYESQSGLTGYPSNDIWFFDTDCVEDHATYAAIARRVRDLAQSELPLEDITDHVDVEAGEV